MGYVGMYNGRLKGGDLMGMFDGPLFDFNGNEKLDFHEFMLATDILHTQMEDDEKNNSFNYDYNKDENDDEQI